jgi:hypothetical protein
LKKFIFITTLTPIYLQTVLRRKLFELYKQALLLQEYSNWEVILIGEENKKEENFIYLKSNEVGKSEKLKIAYDYLEKIDAKPDFIIRLDDDDIISPKILQYANQFDFDCLSDQFHTYYDVTTGDMSQQKRHWLPNTVIHKFEHAMMPYGEQKIPLFMHDHSQAWHRYYADKKVHFVDRKHPVYLRIISPTTITSRMDPNKAKSYVDFDEVEYKKYLATFGKWQRFDCLDFSNYLDQLVSVWEEFSQKKIKLRKRSILNFFK